MPFDFEPLEQKNRQCLHVKPFAALKECTATHAPKVCVLLLLLLLLELQR
jgi:hypothetical protein